MTTSRRTFLGGSAAAVGGLIVADKLRFFTPAESTAAPSASAVIKGAETVYRTGHSNNCDGACGHLVHVVDGRVTMVGPAPWGTKTISGAPAPAFHPRICARGLSQISNTYSPDRIKHPYKRVGPRGSGQWQRISWDQALDEIAAKLLAIRDRYGATAVALGKGTRSGTSVDDAERWLGANEGH